MKTKINIESKFILVEQKNIYEKKIYKIND